MDNKSDSDYSPNPAFVHPEDDRRRDEIYDEEASEVTAMLAVPVGASRAEWGLADHDGDVTDAPVSPGLEDDKALEPGLVLRDRFEIVELVHSGGMGHVYKAIDRRRHQGGSDRIHVAIKMMRHSLAPHVDARLALEREAAKAQHLSHPSIVNIYDFDEEDEQFYLVMEWLEGESVNTLLRRTSGQGLAPEVAWPLIKGIAAGLQHAHSNNVVHADINPSNVFITDTQEIKLLDFGVARYASDPERAIDDGHIWATRMYASPEVLAGSTPTFADDIFSLGCVGYRLLSGRHPFAGLSSLEAEQADVMVEPIPGLVEEQWRTLRRALSYARSDRPRSANVFLADSASTIRTGVVNRLFGEPLGRWLAVGAVVTVALLGGLWWLSLSSVRDEPQVISETMHDVNQSGAEVALTDGMSVLDKLLGNAAGAMVEERFVGPADNNARDLYLEVLARDSSNSIAISGLRAISDVYVQQASTALRDGAPTQALAALAVAAETDPMNPAIAIVSELLIAQGNGQLAKAQLAAAEGNMERAAELLSDAERYAGVDVNVVDAVRTQLALSSAERQFLEALSTAEVHINAGRLLAPPEGNAHAVLMELQSDHQGDARLQASMEALGGRLLASAAAASVAGRPTEATELLDAVEILGVLATEINAARLSLQRAVEESTVAAITVQEAEEPAIIVQEAAESAITDQKTATPAIAVEESAAPASIAEEIAAPITIEKTAETSIAAEEAATLTIAADKPQEVRISSLTDLSIEKFVTPRYPRSARRRGLVGFVDVRFKVNEDGSTGEIASVRSEPGDVFASSAENAVKKWRFAPRDDAVSAQITLRFELDR